jgi:ATP-binding cassette subfamily B protein
MTDTLLFSMIPIVVQTMATGIVIFQFEKITSVVVVMTALTFIVYALIINRWQQPHTVAVNNAEDAEKAFVSDMFTNIESVKYFGKESAVVSSFDSVIDDTRKKTLRNWDFWRWLNGGHNAIKGLGIMLVVLLPLRQVLKGTMTIGTLVFIYATVAQLFVQLHSMSWSVRRLFEAMSNFQSLFPYLKIEQEVKDRPKAKDLIIKKGCIVFDKVTFAYKNRRVVEKVTLVLEPGTKLAVVGPSGGGKTTITKLLYRLYDVNEGSITIDGQDIRDVKQESLRGAMAIVPQDSVLFNDTLFNNIAFSNRKASRKDVVRAMKFAQLDRLVARLPKKERTRVGERGIKLSGGERQRVGIARAILADKRILVLDEATSALDSQTEHEIQADLKELMKGRTTIMIAHRLSTILSADVIAVMDKGSVVQLGKHDELVKQDGIYKRLWNLQKGGFIK